MTPGKSILIIQKQYLETKNNYFGNIRTSVSDQCCCNSVMVESQMCTGTVVQKSCVQVQ